MLALRARSRAGIRNAIAVSIAGLFLSAAITIAAGAQANRGAVPSGSFTLEQVLSYPFATGLTASPKSSRIAWVIDASGVRNVWTA